MNRHVITNRNLIGGEDMQFYIMGNTGRWLVGAGAHPDAKAIDIHLDRHSPFQAQLMVNQLVVMLI